MQQKKSHRIVPNLLKEHDGELAKACRNYLDWLRVKNYSQETIVRQHYVLNFFLVWCLEREINLPTQVTHQLMVKYEAHVKSLHKATNIPISAKYQHTRLVTVRRMFAWLMENGAVLDNPAAKMNLPKLTVRTGVTLNHEQIEDILVRPDLSTPFGLRDRAILELLYSTGLRRKEMVALELGDVNLHGGVLYVRNGKGAKQRVVPIGERAIAWLTKYFTDVRAVLAGNKSSSSVFLTFKGTGFTISGFANRIYPYVHLAGNGGGCHVFRHSMATGMLEGGANIFSIQEILGHEQLSSTTLYTKVSLTGLRKVYAQTHPLEKVNASRSDNGEKISGSPLGTWVVARKSRIVATEREPIAATTILAQRTLEYLDDSAKKFSPNTVSKSRMHLRMFIKWCHARAIKDPALVTHTLCERYHRELFRRQHNNKPLVAAYIARHLISIRGFFAWLAKNGLLLHNPASKLKLPKKLKTLPYLVLTTEEVEKVLATVDTTDLIGARDRTLLELLWATGLRNHELLALTVSDVDLLERTLRVKNKTKERIIPITTRAQSWLEFYLQQVRPKLARQEQIPEHNSAISRQEQTPQARQDALFITRYGCQISASILWEIPKHYLKRAGINKPNACKIFRHTLATMLIENGADIRYVQQILGHSNLKSTQVYAKVGIQRLKEVHAQTHPAGALRKKSTNEITSE